MEQGFEREDVVRAFQRVGLLGPLEYGLRYGDSIEYTKNPYISAAGLGGPVMSDIMQLILGRYGLTETLARKTPLIGTKSIMNKYFGANIYDPITQTAREIDKEASYLLRIKDRPKDRRYNRTYNETYRREYSTGGFITGPEVPDTKENPADRVDPFTGAPYSDQMARLGLVKGGRANKDLNDVVLQIEYARLIKDNPQYKDVSYDTFKRNAQVLIDNTKFAESKNKNLARGKNKLRSSASGYYQFLEGSVPTAYNRATNRFFTGEQSKIFQPILDNNDSSAVSENIQDALFLSNMFESKGSDKYLTPALFEGNKEASMNAYLYNHHTLSSKEKAYNDATIKQAKKIWGVN